MNAWRGAPRASCAAKVVSVRSAFALALDHVCGRSKCLVVIATRPVAESARSSVPPNLADRSPPQTKIR
jgi:hypothetical protein